MTNKIFVYGTLKSTHNGMMAQQLASVSKPISLQALMPGALIYNLGGFPGINLSDEDAHQVVGELLELNSPETTMKWLDNYEGYPSLYDRKIVTILDDQGQAHEAWVYIYNRDLSDHRHIINGEWNGGSWSRAAE